jgi:hypothetical protein
LCLARLAAVSDETTLDDRDEAGEPHDAGEADDAGEPHDSGETDRADAADATGADDRATQVDEELAAARQRVAEVPAEVVVINHAMGLYELAAIHLSAQPAGLAQAALAIDAFACLVEGVGDRLGPDGGVLRDALHQIRLAFVQIKGAEADPSDSGAGEAAEG